MKTITIGRGDGCDILIDDYRVSRRHAVLKLYTFGKMEIVDIGQNGTWVNGVKLRPGVPFPVRRSDVINFAEASQLNWAQVESPMKYIKIAGAIAVALLLLGLLVFWITSALSDTSTQIEDNTEMVVKPVNADLEKDSVSFKSPSKNPSNEEKPVQDTEVQKKKEKQVPRTVQELFPQKIKSQDKKEEKDVKKDEKKKKEEKTQKPKDNKKSEEKSTNKMIY